MLYIRDVTIFSPAHIFETAAVLIEDTRIVEMGPTDQVPLPAAAQVVEGEGLWLVPGFIDLQLNGAFGHDFTANPETIGLVAAQLPRYGVTAFLPTIITAPLETIAAAQTVVTQEKPALGSGALPLGLHLEGPFPNPAKKGAHNPAHLRAPSLETITEWSPEKGVRLVTLAPELPGALPVIKALTRRGVVVSAGHSAATYEEALAGFAAGITYGTHIFNAMPSLQHRAPNLAGALLTYPRLTVGLIPDGIHVHPAMIELVWAAKAGTRLSLVSDAIAALGMPPGSYLIGDQTIIVSQQDSRLTDGTLAGSILSLDVALRNLITFTGCPLSDALATVTTTPATVLGLSDHRGQIAPGYLADLVLLTPELEVVLTIVAGEVVYEADKGSSILSSI
jgi:N-acetylglucosamine-6-phosphate deacetylase